MAARLQHPEVASSFSQNPVSIPCPHDWDKKRPPDAGRDSKVLRSHRHSDERNDVGGVRSAIEDTLLDNGEETCLDRSDGAQYDRNDGAQPMNRSSTRRSTICADSRKSSSSPFATIVRADERSLTVNCNITDGKPFIKGDCKRLKIERAFHRNSCNFSKISTVGDFNIDKRVKKLAKKDTHLREDDLNLFQGSLFSAKEKRDDGDDGFAIVNSNTTCSKVEDEMVLNSREEHDCRQNEMFALSPESDLSCKVSHEGSGTSHLSTHVKVDHKSENYVLQSPECSLPEEDSIDEHSDYLGTALQGLSQEDAKGRKSSPQSESSPFVTNMHKACRSIHEYQRLSKINEGVHGVVFKAQNKKTGEIVAVKKVKLECEKDGFPITSIREINILLSMDHPSVVAVKEIAVDEDLGSVYMVMEHMEQDLAGLLATHKSPFSQSEVKYMMLQLLRGVEYIHSNWVLHRDLKPSNLLVDSQGMIKICDFGLARQYGSPLKTCTHKVVSLWYRDPALLLGSHKYSTAVDMWSVGCIMAELLGKVPLFKGCSELDQLKKIVAVLGRPDEIALQDKLPGVQFNFLRGPVKSMLREKFPPMSFTGKTPLSDSGFNLLSRLLIYDPNKRISAGDAVRHGWFREDPLPKPSTSY